MPKGSSPFLKDQLSNQTRLINHWFSQATKHHQASHYRQAKELYTKIINQNVKHADAWHLRGLTKAELGELVEGIDDIQRAIQIKSDYPPYWVNLGLLNQRRNNWKAAMQAYHQALQLDPSQNEACIYLGNCYLTLERPSAAVPYYQQVLAKDPKQYTVWHNLGNAYMAMQSYHLALEAYDQAIKLNDNSIETICNKGVVYFEQGHYNLAILQYQQALNLNSNYAPAYNNLGLVYSRTHDFPQAEQALLKAITCQPNYAEAYNHLGSCYKDQGKVELALQQFQKAIRLKADYPEALFNLAITELVLGDFNNGWAHYESRHQLKEHRENAYHLAQPFWQGESLVNKTVFILAEQGLGDTIQFIRFIPDLENKANPKQIFMECQAPLIPLLKPHFPQVEFVPRGKIPISFDVQTHLMSLPHFLKITLATIPAVNGYLEWPDSQKFSNLIQSMHGIKKIGLVWAGNPQHKNDHNRSINLVHLKPLFEIPHIHWYSLQWGEHQHDIQEQHLSNKLVDLANDIQDFSDTASILNQLDLMITVDTAMAHLSGALGKPVWVLLPFAPDFRWLLNRCDSPWYQSMRLYRQSQPGDWNSIIQRLLQELNT